MKQYIILLILYQVISINASTFSAGKIILENEARQVTTNTSEDEHPSISDDGNLLLFSSNRDSSYDILYKNLKTGKTEKVVADPNDEIYPFFSEDSELYFISNSLNVNGSLFSKDMDPAFYNDKSNYSIVERELNRYNYPSYSMGDIYYTSTGKKDFGNFYRFNISEDRKYRIFRASGRLCRLSKFGSKFMFLSNFDENGFNNLFTADLVNDSLKNIEQITFGDNIIFEFSISPKGKYIAYSVVNRDINGDKKINIYDNSQIYVYIDPKVEEKLKNIKNDSITPFSDFPVTGNISARDPVITSSGDIFFTSDIKGNRDIFKTGIFGSVPVLSDIQDQFNMAEYLYERYQYLSISGNDYTQVLNKALMAYGRVFLFHSREINNENRTYLLNTYLKTAELLEVLKRYREAESIYRAIILKFSGNRVLKGRVELKQKLVELKRRNVSFTDQSYELDVAFTWFERQLQKYENDHELKMEYNLKLGEINLQLKNFLKSFC